MPRSLYVAIGCLAVLSMGLSNVSCELLNYSTQVPLLRSRMAYHIDPCNITRPLLLFQFNRVQIWKTSASWAMDAFRHATLVHRLVIPWNFWVLPSFSCFRAEGGHRNTQQVESNAFCCR